MMKKVPVTISFKTPKGESGFFVVEGTPVTLQGKDFILACAVTPQLRVSDMDECAECHLDWSRFHVTDLETGAVVSNAVHLQGNAHTSPEDAINLAKTNVATLFKADYLEKKKWFSEFYFNGPRTKFILSTDKKLVLRCAGISAIDAITLNLI